MPTILPFRPAIGSYTFGVVLRNTEYVFDVRWNSRRIPSMNIEPAWYFDIRDIARAPIVMGIKIVMGVYFGRRSNHELFADGAMVARPVGFDRSPPTFQDMGTRVQIWYFTRDELVEEIVSTLTAGGA